MNNHSVAYLGIPGSFSHAISRRLFGDTPKYENFPSFREIFKAVSGGECSSGVIPVENTVAGSVYENYDLLAEFDAPIVGEARLKIEHHLCTQRHSGALPQAQRIKQITRVFSHPKALEQCQRFFQEYPSIDRGVSPDTANAALLVSKSSDPTLAAICAEEAAALYGLDIVLRNVEDNPQNLTRFVIIGERVVSGAEPDKYSLLFTLPHSPKSLYEAMSILMKQSVNVTKIESRPIAGKPFEYVFYIDFEFNVAEHDKVRRMLDELRSHTLMLKVLGCYPRSATADEK